MKIAVAMSGGVDSSAAAALLKEQGHELVGFTMQLWNQRRGISVDENGDPLMLDSRPSDAIALALRLDCPIYVRQRVLDLSASAKQPDSESEPDDLGPTPDDWPELIG